VKKRNHSCFLLVWDHKSWDKQRGVVVCFFSYSSALCFFAGGSGDVDLSSSFFLDDVYGSHATDLVLGKGDGGDDVL